MRLTIRPFGLGDKASLIAVINVVCGEGCWMSTPCFQPTPAWRHALRVVGCPDHLLLVAAAGEQLIGWCRLFPTSAGCGSAYPAAELGIGLLPQYRDRGHGQRLIRHAVDWAMATGLHDIALTTQAHNGRARRTFERCGFVMETTDVGADGIITMGRALRAGRTKA